MKPALISWCLALALTLPAGAEPLRYNRDIRPILSDNCFACHGPDKAERKGGLRLDVRKDALAELESGERAIVPGKVDASGLIERIKTTDPDDVMPPPKSHKKLTAAQKEMLERWIVEGASYEKHWAFLPPQPVPVPAVQQTQWSRHDLDRFILAELERRGMQPSPEADPATLRRRVALDLTGLPPDESDETHETYVTRLLASPHYGERMAVDWLDAARYADSNGYQVDLDRSLWGWRDWVIGAFNSNLPFDRFTVEQIAGDLLPNATVPQRIATGFHRNHMLNTEGGVIAEEFEAEYTADRVETTAAVWLGQTFNCCRCHDHKFDPFTQRDFYSLKAFFNNVGESAGPRNITTNRPDSIAVNVPDPKLDAEIAKLEADYRAAMRELDAAKKAVTDPVATLRTVAAESVKWQPATLTNIAGATGGDHVRLDGREALLFDEFSDGAIEFRITISGRLPRITAMRIEVAPGAGVPQLAEVRWRGVAATVPRQPTPALKMVTALAGFQPIADADALFDNADKTFARIAVPQEKRAAVVAEVDPPVEAAKGRAVSSVFLTLDVEQASHPSRWTVSVTDADPTSLIPDEVRALLEKPAGELTEAETAKLKEFAAAHDPATRAAQRQVEAARTRLNTAQAARPTTLVMNEMAKPRETFVLMRGAYDKAGDKVLAATPAVLPALREDLPHNRLGLAQWLVDPANPLTARVTVNRLWQSVFGTGLVRTSEDFGAQGEAPSHPELLDWLALEFVRSGWDVKGFMRMLVTSATYRQSSVAAAAGQRADPENRLLWRGPRFRLQAEFLRDQALAAAGLLVDEKIGGPSVKPYQPAGLYDMVNTSGRAGYVEGKGDDLYRRSLYTYWKRSIPHPAMLAFDAPFREVCTIRRNRSNTPLQALNLMNDPTYVEAARHLAARMIAEGGTTAPERIAHGYRLLLARTPTVKETAVLERSLARALTDFQTDPKAATALLKVGTTPVANATDEPTLAAYTTLASTLLCLSETVTKP